MNTIKFASGNVKMVAHRGCSGLEKENTNSAFVAAGSRSYFGIESDVHITADGKYVSESEITAKTDVFGHKQLGGMGAFIANAVKERFGCKTRAVELNLPQRCAAHILSAADIDEGVRIGKAAVKKAVAGISGRMITVTRGKNDKMSIGSKDVQKIANAVRCVPAHYINNEGNYVTKECLEYLVPLVKGEKKLKYENGLPVYFKF